MPTFTNAFVTGATGLLGNNLVRALVERGHHVKALVRSRAKAGEQFSGLDVQVVEGDMNDLPSFKDALRGVDVLFHTAAFFRDSYKGGRHWDELYRVNVTGTEALLEAAYDAGIRRLVHTSSGGVLDGPPGALIDETMARAESDANDYFRSKILCDRSIHAFLKQRPDFHGTFVLPGFMFGPGDMGPTASGQLVLDFARESCPGWFLGASRWSTRATWRRFRSPRPSAAGAAKVTSARAVIRRCSTSRPALNAQRASNRQDFAFRSHCYS